MIAEAAFTLLTRGPDPLRLPVAELTPAGGRSPVIDERLRELLCAPDTALEVKNLAWSVLVEHAQRHGGAWMIAAVGMALPRLKFLSAGLVQGAPTTASGGRAEVDAEVLAGFLNEVTRVDPRRRALFPHLIRAAHQAGVHWLRHQRGAEGVTGTGACHSNPPPALAGHPDLVLARAVAEGVLTDAEAVLIGETRLGEDTVTAFAARVGLSREAVWKRRRRAESRLAVWLREALSESNDCQLDPTGFLATHPQRCPDPRPRPPFSKRGALPARHTQSTPTRESRSAVSKAA